MLSLDVTRPEKLLPNVEISKKELFRLQASVLYVWGRFIEQMIAVAESFLKCITKYDVNTFKERIFTTYKGSIFAFLYMASSSFS